MSYAIVEIGGMQHRVSPGDEIRVQRLNSSEGDSLTLDKVLIVQSGEAVRIGTPYVEGASVSAKVLGEVKGKKVLVFKKKRRKQYRRLRGHRQIFTSLQIDEIRAGD